LLLSHEVINGLADGSGAADTEGAGVVVEPVELIWR
jgi:hypothetical protein